MSSGRQASKPLWEIREFQALIGLLVILGATIYYGVYINPYPADVDLWPLVMEAYPNGGMACHASLMDRVLRMSDVLRDSPYVGDGHGNYQAIRLADKLAIDMVIHGGGAPPPECHAGDAKDAESGGDA